MPRNVRYGALSCLCVLVLGSCKALAASQDSYVAAVFESSPNQTIAASPAEGLQQMVTTLASYKPFFAEAANSGAEILVLNEMGISGFSFTVASQVTAYLIELPSLGAVPCTAAESFSLPTPTSQVLPALSCAAKDLNVTLVVDLAERRPCARVAAPCPARGYFQFNTQIALLGGSGALTSVYVKNHLFLPGNEGNIFDSAPWQPSYATFKSHTGRLFGQAVCFDLFYPNPILALAGMGVRDIVFSSYWENLKSYPLVTASSLQRAVSEAANVNLLAVSVGYSWQNSGSGLYSQGRILNATFNQENAPRSTLLTSVVPSLVPHRPLHVGLPTAQEAISDTPLAVFGGGRAPPAKPTWSFTLEISQSVTHEGIQCIFDMTVLGKERDTTLALIAQDGQYMVGAMRTQLCAMQECPMGECSLSDIPVPLSTGVTLQRGSMEMRGFTAVRGLVAAVGPHGSPVSVPWLPWQQSSSFGILSRGVPLQVTGVNLLGTFPYFAVHPHLPQAV